MLAKMSRFCPCFQRPRGTALNAFEINAKELDEEECCWICLDDKSRKPLASYCGCTVQKVHRHCLETWQFTNIGKVDETMCRFCQQQYKCQWNATNVFNPQIREKLEKIEPIVRVQYQGVIKKIKLVSHGIDGFTKIMSRFPVKEDSKDNNVLIFYIPGEPTPQCLLRGYVTTRHVDEVFLCAKLAYLREENKRR
jgi:hypothetical protein